MREIAALELARLVGELQQFVGFYIDKFYETGKGSFRIRITRKGAKADLICTLKKGIYSTGAAAQAAGQPSSFAMAVRKRITGYCVESIEQHSNDRIVLFKLKRGDDTQFMIFERMGKGNVLIADNGMKITLAYASHDFKDRSVRGGQPYSLPKGGFIDYGKLDPELRSRFRLFDKNATIISFLAKSVNIGSLYIEDALARAGVGARTRLHEVGEAGLGRVLACIESELADAERGGCFLYMGNGKPVDYAVCDIAKYSGMEKRTCGSLQEAMEAFYGSEEEEKDTSAADELMASIRKQEQILAEMDKDIEDSRRAGELIFKNMHGINSLIEELKKNRRATAEELKERFPGIAIEGLDLKSKTVTIEVE